MKNTKIITIPNLDKYQHYKDRHIVWIKLYVDILQDHKFLQLTDSQRWLFIGLILLAVKNDNRVPYDTLYIAHMVLHKGNNAWGSVVKNIKKLVDLQLIAIKLLASCYQDAIEIRKDKIRKDTDIKKEAVNNPSSKNTFLEGVGWLGNKFKWDKYDKED